MNKFKVILISLILALGLRASAQTVPTSVTGTLYGLNGKPAAGSSLLFELKGCPGPAPTISGAPGRVVETRKTIFADRTGKLKGTIYGNDAISCSGAYSSHYAVTVMNGSVRGATGNYCIQNSLPFNYNTAITCPEAPVPNNVSYVYAQRGPWDLAANYVPYDVVFFNGSSYSARIANINKQPDTYPDVWYLLLSGGAGGSGGTQVQSNWAQLDTLALDYIKNKPTLGTIAAHDTSEYEPASANIQAHILRTDNPHNVSKAQVGLGNVDNTSDMDKPVSTAQSAAINSVAGSNASAPAELNIRYVSQLGNDTNDGLSWYKAKATCSAAISSLAGANGVIYIAPSMASDCVASTGSSTGLNGSLYGPKRLYLGPLAQATATSNENSQEFRIAGSLWNGSKAVDDFYTIQVKENSGAMQDGSDLLFSHSSISGGAGRFHFDSDTLVGPPGSATPTQNFNSFAWDNEGSYWNSGGYSSFNLWELAVTTTPASGSVINSRANYWPIFPDGCTGCTAEFALGAKGTNPGQGNIGINGVEYAPMWIFKVLPRDEHSAIFNHTGLTADRTYLVPDASGTLALLESPAFTGTPTAPTPVTSDNSTTIATTAWVKAQGYGTGSGGGTWGSITGTLSSQTDLQNALNAKAPVSTYKLTDTGAAAGWYKLGTWVANGFPDSLRIILDTGNGYNSNSNQQTVTTISARTSNGLAQVPNLSGVTAVSMGQTDVVTGVKFVATSGSTSSTNASWDIYLNLSAFAGGIYSVYTQPGASWAESWTTATDPGSASSTVVVGNVFNLLDNSGNLSVPGNLTVGSSVITGDHAGVLVMRNGVNNQLFRVYQSSDGSGNDSWLDLGYITGDGRFSIQTMNAGTSPLADLYFSGATVKFGSSGSTRWLLSSNGHFWANADNSYDIGASGANRPRYVYAGTEVIAPMFRGTLMTPSSSSAACSPGEFADDADFHYVCTAPNTWKRVALLAF